MTYYALIPSLVAGTFVQPSETPRPFQCAYCQSFWPADVGIDAATGEPPPCRCGAPFRSCLCAVDTRGNPYPSTQAPWPV